MKFRGEKRRALDAKGRLILPSEFRQIIENSTEGEATITVTTAYETCLVAYVWPEWEKLEKQIEEFPNPSPAMSNFFRRFIGRSEIMTLDGQGRIRLSEAHRAFAKLEREVTVLGMLGRFEIWNPDLLERNDNDFDPVAISEEFRMSGLPVKNI